MRGGIVIAWTLAAFAAACPTEARADDDKCTRAYERGQQLRIAKHPSDAAAEFATCVLECPAVLAKDCRTWQDEVVREIPKLTVRVVGSDGCEAKGQRLRLDDATATFAPGARMDLDPGKHKITALAEGGAVHDEVFTVEPGEKKVLDVVLATKACTQVPTVVSPRTTDGDAAPATSRPVPTAAWILGGIGVVGLGSFLGFAISGNSQRSDLDDRCKPSCPGADVDAMQRTYLIADVSLVVGVVALAAATYIYLTRPVVGPFGARSAAR